MDDRDKKIADMNAGFESRAAGDGLPDKDLRETLLRLNAILNNIPDIAWLKDRESRFIAVNGPFGEACGFSPADLVGKTDLDIWPKDLADSYRADDAEVMRSGKRKRVEELLIGPDGRETWIETIKTPILDAQGRVIGTTGIARDITERKQVETKIRNVTRLYSFLGQINQAIVRTRDRDELFRTICRVAIEFGQFRMAWVGLVDAGSGIVRPAAHAGREEGYLNILSIDISDEATSRGPTGSALREGVLTICDDIATDPRMLPWREEALKRGYRSSAAIPFRLKEKVVGSLNLYAVEPGFFTGDERKLLTEIGADISFALYTMEGEKERKRTEEALYLKNYVFDVSIAANSTADTKGVITQANQAFLAIWGYADKGEVIGKSISWFLQNADEAVAVLDALSASGKWEGNFTARKKDGSTFSAFGLATILKDEQGTMIGYQSSVLDVTDRKRDEEDLRRRTRGLAALLEVSKGLAATLDMETLLQAATDSVTHLFGMGTAAVYLLEGDTLRLGATTPPLPPQFPEALRNALLADHPHIREAMTSGMSVFVPDMVTADLTPAERAVTEQRGLRTVLYLPLIAGVKSAGTLIAGSVSEPRDISELEIDLCRTLANLVALAVENSRLYTSGKQYAADLERQITERKKAEQERLELERRLLHAQKLESLGILAGGIAHDFNNLLMAVLGNLDLALRKLSPVSPARLNIEHSAQAASRAADLTRQMLAYSGKGSFIIKPLDLSELVAENAHLFRSSVARTTELNVRLDRPLPAIEADAGQVQQVIMNLITNASEAIGERTGVITLATGVQDCDSRCLKRSRIEDVPDAGRFVFLEVSDNGCGMDEQTQQRLFDPFFTTKPKGRGLGMSAILGIVRGHRGALFVESTEGRGTTIRVLFPASHRPLAVNDGPAGETAREAADPVVGGMVLVVDDEEIVRNVCKEMVEAFGLQVLTAVDGRDAVEVFTKHADDISLVILDLSMPNMDGMAAFKELVRIKPGVKVVLCSGFDEQDSLQHFSGKGLAGFIQKPYSLKNLREALEKAGFDGE